MNSPRYLHRVTDGLLIVLSVLVWAWWSYRLRLEWEFNPQYAHGKFVPLLAGLLIWLRWADRPSFSAQPSRLWPCLLVAFAALWLPTEIVAEANPDWRLPLALGAVVATGMTLACLAHRGGLSWVRHFLPALGLFWFALPWPTELEALVNGVLVEGVMIGTTEIVNLLGVAVARFENTLRLPEGSLGVEEACSGIRSLHGSLFVAYLLGEIGRWSVWARSGLICLGALIAIGLNVLRAVVLTLIAAEHGMDRTEKLHDQLGLGISVIVLLLLLGAFVFLDRRVDLPLRRWFERSDAPVVSRGVPWWGVSVSLFLMASGVLASEIWFAPSEKNALERRVWIDWSAGGSERVERREIPRETRAILRYSQGTRRLWDTPKGIQVQAFAFRWGSDRISLFNSVHRPEVCLPSAGLRPLGAPFEVAVTTRNGEPLHFTGQDFALGGHRLFVWFGLWDEHLNLVDPEERTTERWQRAWERQRVRSRDSLELVLTGAASWQDAERLLREWVGKAVTILP